MKLTLTVSENVGKKIISRGHTFEMADVMTSNNPAELFQKELVRMTEEVMASVGKDNKLNGDNPEFELLKNYKAIKICLVDFSGNETYVVIDPKVLICSHPPEQHLYVEVIGLMLQNRASKSRSESSAATSAPKPDESGSPRNP